MAATRKKSLNASMASSSIAINSGSARRGRPKRTCSMVPNPHGESNSLGSLTDERAIVAGEWLRRNYERDEDTSMPRSALYEHYYSDCRAQDMAPVNPATLGKVIRAIFSDLKTRRLGTRGNSRYHYFGIKLRSEDLSMESTDAGIKAHRPTIQRHAGKSPNFRTVLKNRPSADANDSYRVPLPNFDEFIRFLSQICTPITANLVSGADAHAAAAFCASYQRHQTELLKLMTSRSFRKIESALNEFWLNLPEEHLACLQNCGEMLRVVTIVDDYLYQVVTHALLGNVFEPIPITATQSIRQFAKHFDLWMMAALENAPVRLAETKTDLARRFGHVLRRRTSLNHLAQAVKSILSVPEHVNQILHDWGHVDFVGIKNQTSWIIQCRESYLASGSFPCLNICAKLQIVQSSFRRNLQDGVTLQVWSEWLEALGEQCISAEINAGGTLESASRQLIMRWSFFNSMIMRDLTLRSATSFGSFHLLRLLFDEYILFFVERKLEDHRRAISLTYWSPEALAGMDSPATDFFTSAYNMLSNSAENAARHIRNENIPAEELVSANAQISPNSFSKAISEGLVNSYSAYYPQGTPFESILGMEVPFHDLSLHGDPEYMIDYADTDQSNVFTDTKRRIPEDSSLAAILNI